jgi:hypothetical protein
MSKPEISKLETKENENIIEEIKRTLINEAIYSVRTRFVPKDTFIIVYKKNDIDYSSSELTSNVNVVETYLKYLFYDEKFRVAAKFSRIVKIRNPERVPQSILELKNRYDAGIMFVLVELSEIKYTVRQGEIKNLDDIIKVRGYIITVYTISHIRDVEKVMEEHKNIPLWLVGTKIDRKSRLFRHVISYYFIPV